MQAQLARPPMLKTEVAFAGFWRRLLAWLIDGTLLFGAAFAIFGTVHILAPDNLDALANIAPVWAVIAFAYYVVLESSPARGTLGKLALGLYVADLRGDPIGF